jgi:hypothetical protein
LRRIFTGSYSLPLSSRHLILQISGPPSTALNKSKVAGFIHKIALTSVHPMIPYYQQSNIKAQLFASSFRHAKIKTQHTFVVFEL